jgi:hypothetical protein
MCSVLALIGWSAVLFLRFARDNIVGCPVSYLPSFSVWRCKFFFFFISIFTAVNQNEMKLHMMES